MRGEAAGEKVKKLRAEQILPFLHAVEKLKCNTRHSWTSSGRAESVAEHSWRLALMSWLVRGEFPELNWERAALMCLVHDIGEAVCGDIPAFEKTGADREEERRAVERLLPLLPERERQELSALFEELSAGESTEARVVLALDKLEAVLQHNEAGPATWLPLERELQQRYGAAEADGLPYLRELRAALVQDARRLLEEERPEPAEQRRRES